MNSATIVGISSNESGGKKYYTLHLVKPFDGFQNNPENGRFCEGQKVEAVNAGGYDCSRLEVGQEIEVYYEKAVTTSKGTFQPIALIRVISE